MYYLKYRPATISELDNLRVQNILKKLLESKEIPHALLFIGQKGSGKTSAARIFSKSINCLNRKEIEPCNACKNCVSIQNSSFTDVVEMDAASNRGIEEIKNLIRETNFMPMVGNFRVFIVDEAHMITGDGFNALLKTLEEPPKTSVFILATTNPEKLPNTIVSRCVKVNFGYAQQSEIIKMFQRICGKEQINLSDKLLELLAQHSDRSFRDAAKLLEEVVIQKIKTIEEAETFLGIRGKQNFLKIIEENNPEKIFSWLDEFSKSGGNTKMLIEDILDKLRIILLQRKKAYNDILVDSSLSTEQVMRLIKLMMEAYQNLRLTPIESLPLEIAICEFYNDIKIKVKS